MYCPICGKELIMVVRKNPEDEYDFCDENFDWNTYKPTKQDDSDWYKCNGCKCFGDDYPLICHHPLRGMESRPGDSWSLSWLK
jgi:hypothetical protein